MSTHLNQTQNTEAFFFHLCEKGQLNELESFFEKVPNVSKKSLSQGLLICCKNFKILSDHQDIVQLLINKGANVNQQESTSGITSLIYAILKNSYQLAETLIENNANYDLEDSNGKNALIYLLESKESETLELSSLVIQNMTQTQLNGNALFSPIIIGVKNGYYQIVESLVSKKIKLDVREKVTMNSLLHLAVLSENEKIISFLLKNGLKNQGNLNKDNYLPSDLTKNEAILQILKTYDSSNPQVS